MENVDPVGIHTGDSIVIAPCLFASAKTSLAGSIYPVTLLTCVQKTANGFS